jgi:hypothetical protein
MSPIVGIAQPPTGVIREVFFRRGWDIERGPHGSQTLDGPMHFETFSYKAARFNFHSTLAPHYQECYGVSEASKEQETGRRYWQ